MKLKNLLYCLIAVILVLNIGCTQNNYKTRAISVLKDSVLLLAKQNLAKTPQTITDFVCERSAGGIHDFYSEGDYWWPDSLNINGPYIRRDGLTNPENFTAHRKAMIQFSRIVGNLASAYLITGDIIYAKAIKKHLRAWFINDSTRMNPNLLYAQAIKGIHTGRGIGIIDAIHLMEVVRAVMILEQNKAIDSLELQQIRDWFASFTQWLTTHKYGYDEMVHPNNHGTCWNMQVGLYAKFTYNDTVFKFCQENYKNNLLPNQMANDGSFPLELERTKPYGYSLFNLDAMVMNCYLLSDEKTNLWEFTTPDGKNIKKGLEYMAPYIANKESWPLAPDVMYWNYWPVAQPALFFGAFVFNNQSWFELWAKNKHFLETEEVIRNVPIRNPIIWLE